MKGMTAMNFLNQVVLADAASGNAFGTYGMILIWVLVFAAMYFFILRPSSKKKKEEAQMRNSLEIGDEITTIGGIMGRVVAIKDDEDAIIIETGSDRVKMKFKKWCISTVDTVKEAPAKEKSSDKEEKTEELKSVMYHLVENLRRIAILINPYMKHTSEKMLNQLNIPEELRTWDSLADYDKLVNIKVTDKPEVLFARLETEPEIEVIKEMMK